MVKPTQAPATGDKALELTMRDVLSGLTDAASQLAYAVEATHIEILSVELPRDIPHHPTQRPDNVLIVDTSRSHNVVDYLIRRESLAVQRVATG